MDSKERVLEAIREIGFDGEKYTATTKEIAEKTGLTVLVTYAFCRLLEKDCVLMRIGYNLGNGVWESVENSNHHYISLTWQII